MRLLKFTMACVMLLAMLCVPTASEAHHRRPLRKAAQAARRVVILPVRLFARAGHGHERGGCTATTGCR